ncbi:MAG: biotin--[acetyl-CoA-carboxylase] ligase, partial [Planctomycetota bacterium]
MLDEAALRRDTFVATIEQHDELGSTSDRALELCRSGLPALPALVYAERQTAGRGRQGKSWWSAEGGLTFSLVVDPRSLGLAEEHQSAVAFRVGVAVTQALAETWPPRQNRPAMDCWVKWPNDVCVGWRKVAGVLVEAPVAPCGTRPLVIGVGINLNNLSADAPLELQTRVASVQELVGRRVTPAERGQLLAGLISGIERQLRDIAG